MAAMSVVQVDPPLILAAIDLHRLHQLSLWNALILQSASAAGCRERFGARGKGRSVHFRDPDGSLLEFISYAGG